MKHLRRQLAALLLGAALLAVPAHAVVVTLDGAPMDVGETPLYDGATYVPIRGVSQAIFPQAQILWENGQAVVRYGDTTITATPGETYMTCNGERIDCGLPIRLENGRTLVPVRPLAAVLGVQVTWYAGTRVADLTTSKTAQSTYSEEDLYWLARIISAESRGEPWEGQIAVGNVVLNRVQSPDFPDTIYDVIFDDRWGGQFEPVRNGTVYNTPSEESVQAAVACLDGANTVGDSLYFLAPDLTANHWTMENREYVTTIGVHWFYR